MAEERKVSPLVIAGIGVGVAAALIGGIYALARAAPEVYTCPICGTTFSTLEALQEHFETEHPHEPIEIIWE